MALKEATNGERRVSTTSVLALVCAFHVYQYSCCILKAKYIGWKRTQSSALRCISHVFRQLNVVVEFISGSSTS